MKMEHGEGAETTKSLRRFPISFWWSFALQSDVAGNAPNDTLDVRPQRETWEKHSAGGVEISCIPATDATRVRFPAGASFRVPRPQQ